MTSLIIIVRTKRISQAIRVVDIKVQPKLIKLMMTLIARKRKMSMRRNLRIRKLPIKLFRKTKKRKRNLIKLKKIQRLLNNLKKRRLN
jgi:hypothetical protein